VLFLVKGIEKLLTNKEERKGAVSVSDAHAERSYASERIKCALQAIFKAKWICG
jgi:hypothetical protein